MNLVKPHFAIILKFWVISIAALVVVAPTDIDLSIKVFGLVLLGMLHWPLWVVRSTARTISCPVKKKLPIKFLFIVLFIQITAANYASRFYTGSSLVDSFLAVLDGVNTYSEYQSHFAEESFSSQPFYSRLPAIFSLAIVKGSFLFLLSVFVSSGYSLRWTLFLSLFPSLPIVLFSMSRGTFFEVFEVTVAVVYFFSTFKSYELGLRRNRFRWAFFGIVGAGVLSFIFLLNTSRRFGSLDALLERGCFTNFCFSPYGILHNLEYLLYSLSVYFSMGVYMFGEYFSALLRGEMAYSILPFFYYFSGQPLNGLSRELCSRYFECGGVWTPDIFKIFSIFGFFVFFFAPLVIRKTLRIERRVLLSGSAFALPFLYTVLIFFISLPVGKFFTGSSANVITCLFFLGLLVAEKKLRLGGVSREYTKIS